MPFWTIVCSVPGMLVIVILVLNCSVGSTNFDMRSFELNNEASLNVYVYDAGFAQYLTQVFERDLASSTPYSLEHWRHRGWREKFEEGALNPARSQL